MPTINSPRLVKETGLTPISDRKGYEIFICEPKWFVNNKKYKIANAPRRTSALEFSGEDLNFFARVLYAEASGSCQLLDKEERDKEKSAIINVNHFRLNREGYPGNGYLAKSFREVCEAPGQFETVFKNTLKFANSTKALAVRLKKGECSDLNEAIEAIEIFLENGPCAIYQFDNFRGYDPKGYGTHIGRTRFYLSKGGASFLERTP